MHNSQQTIEFVQLLTSHQRRLHRYIAVFLPRAADAEDVLQETNAVLWAKADQFQPGSSFLAWATAIARFEIIEYCRRNHRRTMLLDSDLLDTLVTELNDEISDDRRQDALQHCVDKLNASDQSLIAERYDRGASVQEVAERQQRSAGSVYRSLERIRMMLLECINRALTAEERSA